MRPTFAIPLLLLVAVTGCSGTRPYTAQDLRQVRTAAARIVPIYVNFMTAYERSDAAGMIKGYHQEQVACRLEDRVDRRDTIDPNTNLFEASADLDNFCNQIESAYARWAISQHLPYDKTIVPAGNNPFADSQIALAKLPALLAHPADRS